MVTHLANCEVVIIINHPKFGEETNIIFGDTQNKKQSSVLRDVFTSTDMSIVMGSTSVSENQVSFFADHSRGIVIDAEKAIPHLYRSIVSPNSCLAEHNYVVVGKRQYVRFVDELVNLYSGLKQGNLLDKNTELDLIDKNTLSGIASIIRVGEMTDSCKLLYPKERNGFISQETIRQGAVIEHYSEDYNAGANPLMCMSLPAYVTGVRCVDTVEQALKDMENARKEIEKNGTRKSMAMGIYGDLPKNLADRAYSLAYDLHLNESTTIVKGIIHQGINLNKELTRDS
jgi:hypothetical protein